MNIALLAEFYQQSHIKVPHKPISGHDAAIEDTVFVPEKFAEFIIRECVRHVNEDYQRDFDTKWREDLSKSINQHFGVE